MSDFTPYAVSVEDMTRAHGEHVHIQNEILAVVAPFPMPTALLSFGMDILGVVKQTPLIRSSFLFSRERLTALLHRKDYTLLRIRELHHVSGGGWLCLVGAPSEPVKRLAIALEGSELLARLFDIGVLNCEGRKLSREDFFLLLRHCLLCEEAAVVCTRNRAHSVEALSSRCDSLLREAFPLSASFFSALENHAALSPPGEAYIAPKPGLVNRIDPGAHVDMKLEDFILGTAAITLFLWETVVTAYQSCFTLSDVARETDVALFSRLREIEKRAENKMYATAGGIDTHKDTVFTLGLLSAGARLLYARSGGLFAGAIPDEMQNLIGNILRREFTDLKTEEIGKTHDEVVLHRDGAGDIRNVTAKDFLVFRSVALSLPQQYEVKECLAETSVLNILLYPILHVSDTNVLYRGGRDALLTLRADCRNTLSYGDTLTSEETNLLYGLKETCKQRNVSPGGATDLLSATLFLHRFEKTFR